MINLSRAFKNNRLMEALTGMSISEFRLLALTFEKMLHLHFASKKRLRGVGGGRKGALRNAESKLFFTLFYIRHTTWLASFLMSIERGAITGQNVSLKYLKKHLVILSKCQSVKSVLSMNW